MPFKTARRRQPSLTAKARPNDALTCGGMLRRVAPGVTVMKTARARRGHHCRVRGRLRLHCSMVRRVLLQGIMNAIVMVVVHVLGSAGGDAVRFNALIWSSRSRR